MISVTSPNKSYPPRPHKSSPPRPQINRAFPVPPHPRLSRTLAAPHSPCPAPAAQFAESRACAPRPAGPGAAPEIRYEQRRGGEAEGTKQEERGRSRGATGTRQGRDQEAMVSSTAADVSCASDRMKIFMSTPCAPTAPPRTPRTHRAPPHPAPPRRLQRQGPLPHPPVRPHPPMRTALSSHAHCFGNLRRLCGARDARGAPAGRRLGAGAARRGGGRAWVADMRRSARTMVWTGGPAGSGPRSSPASSSR